MSAGRAGGWAGWPGSPCLPPLSGASRSSAVDSRTGAKVAIKKLYRPFQSELFAKRAYRELRLLKHMRHENVSRAGRPAQDVVSIAAARLPPPEPLGDPLCSGAEGGCQGSVPEKGEGFYSVRAEPLFSEGDCCPRVESSAPRPVPGQDLVPWLLPGATSGSPKLCLQPGAQR